MPTHNFLQQVGVGLLVAAAAALALATDVLAPIRRPVADALVRLGASSPPALPAGLPDVAIVALDPPSLRAFPSWPWPRGLYGELVRRLDEAGAKVTVFDIDFSTPRDPAQDTSFAEAVADSGRVVLAAFRQRTPLAGGGEIEIASLPIPELAEAAAGIGSVLVNVESDGIVRHAPRSNEMAGQPFPSLAGAALAVALDEPALAAALDEPAPTAASAPLTLDYRRTGPAFPVLSMADVIEGRFDPRDVAGRVVIIGATASELQDLWPTPLGPARPGVLLQAVAYRTLAAETAGAAVLRTPTLAQQMFAVTVLSLLAGLAGLGSHGLRLALLGGLAIASVASAVVGAISFGLLLDPTLPLCVLGAHYVLGLEGLRRRFGRGLAERELSLTALFQVGEATALPSASHGLEVALALLGDVLDASGVALFCADPEAPEPCLDGRRLEWRRTGAAGSAEIGDAAAAARVLVDRRLRVFEGARPGSSTSGGLAVYVPLYSGDVPVGVLVVERDDPTPLADTQLRTIVTVGAQLALSAENMRLIEGLRATLDASVAAIATAIEARDGYTEAHCRRLAAFSGLMAERLGLPAEEIEAIRLGALLHDVGKIGIRDEILLKPGAFSAEERADMQRHPDIGHRIVHSIRGLRKTTLDCVRHHHEWWDGTGYPAGLAGSDIPLGARIVAVVDVWDALATDRPYKKALPQRQVLSMLEKRKGVHFDPELVDLFLRILDEEGLEEAEGKQEST